MDALTSTAPAPAPAAAPVPAPAPAPAPAPMPMTAAPMTAAPSGKQGIKDMLKSFNWTEIGFGILGTAVLYYTIYYFRHNMSLSKNFKTDVENKIDELTMKVSDLSSIVNTRETMQKESTPNDLFV